MIYVTADAGVGVKANQLYNGRASTQPFLCTLRISGDVSERLLVFTGDHDRSPSPSGFHSPLLPRSFRPCSNNRHVCPKHGGVLVCSHWQALPALRRYEHHDSPTDPVQHGKDQQAVWQPDEQLGLPKAPRMRILD